GETWEGAGSEGPDVFAVPAEMEESLREQQRNVERIFRVQLSILDAPHPRSRHIWLQLRGSKENVGRAKEFVKGLCGPELWEEIYYPPALHCVFLGAHGLFLDCLCWATSAHLVPKGPGTLLLCGLAEAFALAQSRVEELERRLEGGGALVGDAQVAGAFGALLESYGGEHVRELLALPGAVQQELLSLVREAGPGRRGDYLAPRRRRGLEARSPGIRGERGGTRRRKGPARRGGGSERGVPGRKTAGDKGVPAERGDRGVGPRSIGELGRGPAVRSPGRSPAFPWESPGPRPSPAGTQPGCSPPTCRVSAEAGGSGGRRRRRRWRGDRQPEVPGGPAGPILPEPGQRARPARAASRHHRRQQCGHGVSGSRRAGGGAGAAAEDGVDGPGVGGQRRPGGQQSVVPSGSGPSPRPRAPLTPGLPGPPRHGLHHVFSCRGVALAVQYFWDRGHREITVFVPQWRLKKDPKVKEGHFLTILQDLRLLSFTPSRVVDGKRITPYDDRFMLKLAEETDGVIVTNDQLQDLAKESGEWFEIISERLLPFTFVGNIFMVPDDPLGRKGPTLDEFLRKPTRTQSSPGCRPEPEEGGDGRRREPRETERLRNQLLEIFSGQDQKVDFVLEREPRTRDLNQLSEALLGLRF
uniref:Uncharacterized protein n=1 Tax=Ornithorhynchus anatinus TaxID=9258 RepID=A0A6I8NEI8_ORNAN